MSDRLTVRERIANLPCAHAPANGEPTDYIARSEWAQRRITKGHRQRKCPDCGLYKWPEQFKKVLTP